MKNFLLAGICSSIIYNLNTNKSSLDLVLRQDTLGRSNLPGSSWVYLTSNPQRPCKSLECRLNDVVRILSTQLPDVKGDSPSCRQRAEEMFHKLCVKCSYPLSRDVAVEAKERSSGQILHDPTRVTGQATLTPICL